MGGKRRTNGGGGDRYVALDVVLRLGCRVQFDLPLKEM